MFLLLLHAAPLMAFTHANVVAGKQNKLVINAALAVFLRQELLEDNYGAGFPSFLKK